MDDDFSGLLVCRACLASDVELILLSSIVKTTRRASASSDIVERIQGISGTNQRQRRNEHASSIIPKVATLLDYFNEVLGYEDMPELPMFICLECSSALKISYSFRYNAREAYFILKEYIDQSNTKFKRVHRSSGKSFHDKFQATSQNNKADVKINLTKSPTELTATHRYRCKICGERLDTRKNLKDHLIIHSDLFTYSCELCTFQCAKRSHLAEHYAVVHDTKSTRDQLKPKTSFPKVETTTVQEQQKELGTENHELSDVTADIGSELPIKEEPHNEVSEFVGINTAVNDDVDNLDAIEEMTDNGIIIEYIEDNGSTKHVISEELLGNFDISEATIMPNDDAEFPTFFTVSENDEQITKLEDMEFEDIIVEDSNTMEKEIAYSISSRCSSPTKTEGAVSQLTQSELKAAKCKICLAVYSTQEKLKIHMLNHKDIPHFFCDKCSYYTFFKDDLQQHYKIHHRLLSTMGQLQTANRHDTTMHTVTSNVPFNGFTAIVYACDMCLFETPLQGVLRRHYSSVHNIVATDVQLRPVQADFENKKIESNLIESSPIKQYKSANEIDVDYKNGVNCCKCDRTFYSRQELREHYITHRQDNKWRSERLKRNKDMSLLKNSVISKKSTESEVKINNEKDATVNSQLAEILQDIEEIIPGIAVTAAKSVENLPKENKDTGAELETKCSIETKNSSMMTITSSVPSDAVPQIVEMDIIENDFDFDFNGDAFFEDFDGEENNACNTGDRNATENVDDMILTSDDDAANNVFINLTKTVCVHCGKEFHSDYQYENHMFWHRGLAPYRCELCTNLYNTKRSLLRHYRAVHKVNPTRDMLQAKGDKVCGDSTTVDLNFPKSKGLTLMCANCPYENETIDNIKKHLQLSHNIFDEKFILTKQPHECPRCIRAFASKELLIHHLQHSHAVVSIVQHNENVKAINHMPAFKKNNSLSELTKAAEELYAEDDTFNISPIHQLDIDASITKPEKKISGVSMPALKRKLKENSQSMDVPSSGKVHKNHSFK